MADIFDQIAVRPPTPGGDIFDQVAAMPRLPPPVPPPGNEPRITAPRPLPTIGPQPQPLPPPATPGPAPRAPAQLPDLEQQAIEAYMGPQMSPRPAEVMTRFIPPQPNIRPAPESAALEGAAIGALTGGVGAPARLAAEFGAGGLLTEALRPYLEKFIPDREPEKPVSDVLGSIPEMPGQPALARGLLEQLIFALPGVAYERAAAAVRRDQPPLWSRPYPPPPPPPPRMRDIAQEAEIVPEKPPAASPLPPAAVAPPEAPIVRPAAPVAQPEAGLPDILPEGGRVRELPTDRILADPETFQYKGDVNAQGVTEKFKETGKFDKSLAGIISVWEDPGTGKTYVVNGHHRLELAKRLNVPSLTVRYLDARDADEARAYGALINIAEGQGTSLDAGRFFRESGMTREQLAERGITMSSKIAREGVGLSKLTPELYRQVQIGEISPERGAIIGNNVPQPEAQIALLRLLGERRAAGRGDLSDRELEQLTRIVQSAEATGKEQTTLFGADVEKQSLAVEKAQLAAFVDQELAKSASAMGYVARRKGEIERAKGNVIDEAASQAIATGARQGRETFQKFAHTQGPISDILNDGARRLSRGEDEKIVKRDTFIAIKKALQEIIPGGGGAGLEGVAAPPVPPQAGLFGSQRGAIEFPDIVHRRVKDIRELAIKIAKGAAPTWFTTDEALDAFFETRGEMIEADRYLYNDISAGNAAFFDRMIGKQGVVATRDYLHRMSTGKPQPTPELQKLAEFHRQILDSYALGASRFKVVPYLENYIPGIFKKPDDAEKWFQASGRRPFEGSKRFFRKKFWRDIGEAIKPKEEDGGGLELVDENPEVLIRTLLEDVRKFVGARSWFERRKGEGALVWKPQNQRMPPGKAGIDDNITKRYFPPDAVPVVIKRENLEAALRKYVQTLTRVSQRLSETTRTEGGGTTTTKADGSPTNLGKVEARVREALTARGFGTGETDQMIARLKQAGPQGAEAAREVIREITERVKTIERTTEQVMNLPPEMWMKGRVATQRFIPAGEWILDENEARVINNILKPDIFRQNPGWRGLMWSNAKMNALQLGFSGFHVTNEALNTYGTKLGHVGAAIARGKPLLAVQQALRVPTAPLEALIRGSLYFKDPAMLVEMLRPAARALERDKLMGRAPGGIRERPLAFDPMSPLRHGMQVTKTTGAFGPGSAVEHFMRAWRRREPGGMIVHFPGAIIDATMAPIFQYIVPRMKVGAYLDVMADEMDRNAAAIADGTLKPGTIARRVVEQIDNRMGMVNYDLWGWNRALKTGMQILFRAPGWNFGYGRAGVRGMADLMQGRFTPAAQFVFGTALAAIIGAEIYQLLHTGKHIENATDVLFPRNGQVDEEGNELRVRFPGPLKDAWGLTHDLVGTFFNKGAPLPTMLWRAFAPESFGGNKDFFGDYIRNKADPWPEQGKQFLSWLIGELTPFSVQQYSRITGIGALPQYPATHPLTEAQPELAVPGELRPIPREMTGEAMMGFTKAPHEVIIGPARRELERLMQQHTRAMGPRTREQKAMDERKRRAQREIRSGAEETPELDALVEEGAFADQNALRQFIINAQRSSTEKLMRKIPKRYRPETTELPSLGPSVP